MKVLTMKEIITFLRDIDSIEWYEESDGGYVFKLYYSGEDQIKFTFYANMCYQDDNDIVEYEFEIDKFSDGNYIAVCSCANEKVGIQVNASTHFDTTAILGRFIYTCIS